MALGILTLFGVILSTGKRAIVSHWTDKLHHYEQLMNKTLKLKFGLYKNIQSAQ